MKLPPLSYTHLSAFKTCPHRYYRQYVKKDLPRAEASEAMSRGIEAHKALEDRLEKNTPLPPGLQAVEPVVAVLAAMPRYRVEYFLGVKADGTSCAWDAKDVWFRCKADFVAWTDDGAFFVDWKTGKVWEDDFELGCQAMAHKAHHPGVPVHLGEFYWIRENRPGLRHTLDPAATRRRVMEIDNRMRELNQRGEWPKTPGPLCGFCDVRDCEHRRERT